MTTTMTTSRRERSHRSGDGPDSDPIVLDESGATGLATSDVRVGLRPSRRSAPLGLIGEQAPLATGPRPPEFIPRTASVLADALGIERPSVVLSREAMARAGTRTGPKSSSGTPPSNDEAAPTVPPLGQALTRLRLRPVPDSRASSLDPEIVTGRVVSGYLEAVWMAGPGGRGDGRWVTSDDLSAWMVDADMILDVCRGHARDVADPPVSIVVDPAGRQILVLESDTPDAVALLPHLARLLRLAPGAEALVALANDHVIVAHTHDGMPGADMAGFLLDFAGREHARRPGLAIPALYRWSDDGPDLVSAHLESAAGRLMAEMTGALSPS